MKQYSIILIALMAISCGAEEQKALQDTSSLDTAVKTIHPEIFNRTFKTALNAYYNLKDYFIAENDTAVDASSQRLILAIHQIQLDSLGGDSSVVITAKSYAEGITAELKGLIGEKGLDAKRKSFQMVSEQLYDFIRTVQYDQEVVYHEFCPMAFDIEVATWLSNSSVIRNPYLPKKMLSCGEVRDSIDLRAIKQ
jgi:Cu(I)/Ag(I) efflux system membrane fusion protein